MIYQIIEGRFPFPIDKLPVAEGAEPMSFTQPSNAKAELIVLVKKKNAALLSGCNGEVKTETNCGSEQGYHTFSNKWNTLFCVQLKLESVNSGRQKSFLHFFVFTNRHGDDI